MASFMPARARIALIAAAVGVAAASVAQDRSQEVRSWQAAWEARQAQEAERREAERIRRDYERRRAIAHARMRSQPDTMHASRPSAAADAMCPVVADPEARREFQRELRQRREEAFRRATGLPLRTGLSVHPVPKRAEKHAPATGSLGMSASFHPSPATAVFAAASSSSAAESGPMVPLFPSASDALGRQGFARVINHDDEAGEVTINAYDDQGASSGPLTLTIGAGETVHFNSADLENGNAGKGLSGGTGPGEGDWRLELDSELDIEVLSYIRTGDGFLTAMHDTAPEGDDGHRIAIFNPGSNTNQQSRLRLVNRGDADASVTITGADDKGRSLSEGATAVLAAHSSVTYTAAELESGNADGLTGSIGDGSGKWRLTVRSEQDIVAMSLLSSPTGHLTNLSTAPDSETDGKHSVPLFPSASDANERQGFLRVVNHGDEAGEVTIDAFDDTDREYETLTLAIGANETKHFNSDDLELGNAGKGLTGSTGAGAGDWRLELTSDLDIEVLAYIRTTDGFLTAIHDPVPRSAKRHRVAVFNPGSNVTQLSVLRLVNAGRETASVTVTGVDDRGESPGDHVAATVPAGGSASYTAAELESGDAAGLDGSLGDGSGKWRLTVNADRPIVAMSLLSSPTGHLTNLSTAPQRGAGPVETADEAFEALVSPIVQSKCVNCHYEGNTTGNMPVFVRHAGADHLSKNLKEFEDYLADIEDGANRILNKIQGAEGHGGGIQVAADTPEFADFQRFLELLGAEIERPDVTVANLFNGVQMAPAWKTLRRAAIIFAGRIPTEDEFTPVESGTEDDLRRAIRRLMDCPQDVPRHACAFHEFVTRGANDRLLTDREAVGDGYVVDVGAGFVDFTNRHIEEESAAQDDGSNRAFDEFVAWRNSANFGFARAPLELIAYIAETDGDYREVVTAPYIMANPWADEAYGASTVFDDPNDVFEFRPSEIVSYHRLCHAADEGYVRDLESCRTDYPHAGILNTTVFLLRYPTTPTNRNRARSRWTYYHFLGVDIENSKSRTMNPDVLADRNNPTLNNPACTACHERMDPVAGAFQNYGNEGYYRDQEGGLDSLDFNYKHGPRPGVEVAKRSWEDAQDVRKTFSLEAGGHPVQLRVEYAANDENDNWSELGVDRLTVVDADGEEVDSLELEDVEESTCGNPRHDETGREGYFWLNGGCPMQVTVEVPAKATYDIVVAAWITDQGEGVEGEPATLSIEVDFHREGDTWYRGMLEPGFVREPGALSETVPEDEGDSSLQWLAQRIVEDDRFAPAAVKFWWPAIMGSEVAEQPQVSSDEDYEVLRLAADAQGREVRRLAEGFRRGFGWSGQGPYNLKDLLVEITMSKWFRAESINTADTNRRLALRDAGAERLLTPEELARKTASITGFLWDRRRYHPLSRREPHRQHTTGLTNEGYRLMYGGIDSDGIIHRMEDFTSMMAGVAQSHAVKSSCPIVRREFYLLPDGDRRLFDGIDKNVSPDWEDIGGVFDVPDREWETSTLQGDVTAGPKSVTLRQRDGVVWADRLTIRNATGEIIDEFQFETLHETDCGQPWPDNGPGYFAFWCGSLEVDVDIPVAGTHDIEVRVYGEPDGDDPVVLSVDVYSMDTDRTKGADAIREKLAELHRELLGVRIDTDSTDVETAYRLFVDVWKRRRAQTDERGESFDGENVVCDKSDLYHYEGILEDSVVLVTREDGFLDYDWDQQLVGTFENGIDFSDPRHVARTWVVVLAHLLMDYRYIYL